MSKQQRVDELVGAIGRLNKEFETVSTLVNATHDELDSKDKRDVKNQMTDPELIKEVEDLIDGLKNKL